MPSIQNNASRFTLFIGILILFGLHFAIPYATKYALVGFGKIDGIRLVAFWITRILSWVCLLLLIIYARKVEKQKLLLYAEKNYNILLFILSMIGIFAALFAGLFFIVRILMAAGLSKESVRLNEMLEMFRANNFLLIFTCLTAGVVEELTFRGYLMPRLEILFKSPVAAVFVSSILFGLLHFGYGTWAQIIAPFFIGLVFAYYYWEFRNIKVVIVCHILWDLLAIYARI